MPVEFRPADPTQSPATELIAEMVAEMQDVYAITGHIGVPLEVGELALPSGVYLVGYEGDAAVAGGGLRTIDTGIGEIKRMYVRPQWRGQGLGDQLLRALEDAAWDLGLTTVRLDTGSRQPGALHLYERSGYVSIGNYNANPHASFWGEKTLRER